jgi:hypothetical protein
VRIEGIAAEGEPTSGTGEEHKVPRLRTIWGWPRVLGDAGLFSEMLTVDIFLELTTEDTGGHGEICCGSAPNVEDVGVTNE